MHAYRAVVAQVEQLLEFGKLLGASYGAEQEPQLRDWFNSSLVNEVKAHTPRNDMCLEVEKAVETESSWSDVSATSTSGTRSTRKRVEETKQEIGVSPFSIQLKRQNRDCENSKPSSIAEQRAEPTSGEVKQLLNHSPPPPPPPPPPPSKLTACSD
uniref:Uncharacterized protein n=1 Tax=Nelumbo nucifera TaxID=4432 RepID=A0A822XEB6_NELNU|nr:TPA_asm: hypothetical protein HUJ06_019990 [Nelumbo nucifera]